MHHLVVPQYGSHVYSDTCCRSIRVRGHWNAPSFRGRSLTMRTQSLCPSPRPKTNEEKVQLTLKLSNSPPPTLRIQHSQLCASLLLVAPYCAIPRDYLSDTPYCALWGFWCLNMANWVRYPPAPLSERFPLGKHAKWRCDTPPPLKRGISAILARYPLKTRQMGAILPSAMLSRKGIARYGGVSRAGPLRSCYKS